MEKPGLILITYSESELIDSISLKPFVSALQRANNGVLNLKEEFEKLKYSSNRSNKCNLTHVSETNLYAWIEVNFQLSCAIKYFDFGGGSGINNTCRVAGIICYCGRIVMFVLFYWKNFIGIADNSYPYLWLDVT